MPFLQSSGAISINDIKTLFGGPTSPSMSNYYKGGAYIPATKTVSEGPFYLRTGGPGQYYWSNTNNFINDVTEVLWNLDTYDKYYSPTFSIPRDNNLTSYTTGGFTYLRGTLQLDSGGTQAYQVSRTSSVTINPNVPSSGVISLSQFYGAEKP